MIHPSDKSRSTSRVVTKSGQVHTDTPDVKKVCISINKHNVPPKIQGNNAEASWETKTAL